MKKCLLPLFLLVYGLVFQSGCNSNGTIIVVGLRIELTGIERTTDGTATVSWRVMNPNVAPYLLARTSHKIYLNGTLVGTTVDNEPMAVPARNNAGKTSKLILAGPAAGRLLAEAVGHGPVSYRLDSSLLVLIYNDTTEKSSLSSTGPVTVSSK